MKWKQLEFPCRGRGGHRPGAGRKRDRRVSHHGRETVVVPIPLHAVWRTREDVRSLRGKKLFRQILASFRRCHEKPGFRITHYCVLGNHVHLIIEADGTAELSRGMQGLGVSMAKRINLNSGRSGAVFDDRFFARKLRTPREVANAVSYVLHNAERHFGAGAFGSPEVDSFCSSALTESAREQLLAAPVTWLLRIGLLRARAGPALSA
jgi:REP element-mobilizing transposase RayT